ncbi:MAG: pantoate--beta-alanine ligase [Actinobacteria bacterium]|uniref:pantoate--beta-alanine ligase (AMP-forming) n=1 Tax=freshwater metagenome TaxID=449393 RepID=A0A6J6CKR2_9ZZZZ|nr:pantoate--beta-alanine ligase [Actinomycetota bacterium]
MKTIRTVQELKAELASARQSNRKIAFVPTMGAIHDGHLSLIKLAKQNSDLVIASIFVNPLQFTSTSDFDLYPRDESADSSALATAGTDILFLPSVAEIYPNGEMSNTRSAGPTGELYEGHSRKGHFDGMLTVVARLFEIVSPDVAVFGSKDAQQLFLIRQMLKLETESSWANKLEIIEGPTIRESNGLALSSRNQRLTLPQSQVALTLSKALDRAQQVASSGVLEAHREAMTVFSSNPEAKLDYLAVVNPDSFEPVGEGVTGRALMIVAAEVGNVRLIDNRSITF